MSYAELVPRYNEWRAKSCIKSSSVFDQNVDVDFELHTVAQIDKEKARFETFIPAGKRREIASDLARALDSNKVQITDLSPEGIPIQALEHKGARYSFDEPDEILASVLKYLEVLINVGFRRNPAEDYKYTPRFEHDTNEILQPQLQELIKEIYAFIEMVYQESQSLASYLPIKGRITHIVENQVESIVDGDSDGYDQLETRISEYLSFLDRSVVEDPASKPSLFKYAHSWNSYSTDELLVSYGPVDYKQLGEVDFRIDQEIEEALEDDEKMSKLRREFADKVINIDKYTANLSSASSQGELVRFMALREFFVVAKENYGEWADFRERTRELSEAALDEGEY
jgi:hypothetical protein